MKRIFTFVIFVLTLQLNAWAGVRAIEVRPLAKTPLLSLKDFKSAEVKGEGDHAVLTVVLRDDAARRMREFTAKNVGRELPFLVDGKFVNAPVVRAPIEHNTFQVAPMDRSLADSVAQTINTTR
jgi:preprotein translocase subunit SecD